MSGISLITPTGARDESFARCLKYVSRFIRPTEVPVQWIIVNDCDPNFRIDVHDIDTTVVHPLHRWSPGENTQSKNLLIACDYIEHDHIIFIEDDDWYSSDYLITMYGYLLMADLVGEIPARYYHVPTRSYRVMENSTHASLCQTGMKSSMIEDFKSICRSHQILIDWNLWQIDCTKMFMRTKNCVGMKGLTGRKGIGIGHRKDGFWTFDPNSEVLSSWIGNDVSLYRQNLAFAAP